MAASVYQLIRQDPIFWGSAIAGSLLFLVQFFLNFLGSDHAAEDGDVDKFKWIAKQATIGFLMMFGWVGLTCKHEFAFSPFATILTAIAGGIVATFLTVLLFKSAKKLHSPGTVFRIEEAVGKEATVYQRIPKGGIGKVSLSLNHLTYEIDAISHLGEEIDSFVPVQIIRKTDDNTVAVVPLK